MVMHVFKGFRLATDGKDHTLHCVMWQEGPTYICSNLKLFFPLELPQNDNRKTFGPTEKLEPFQH